MENNIKPNEEQPVFNPYPLHNRLDELENTGAEEVKSTDYEEPLVSKIRKNWRKKFSYLDLGVFN